MSSPRDSMDPSRPRSAWDQRCTWPAQGAGRPRAASPARILGPAAGLIGSVATPRALVSSRSTLSPELRALNTVNPALRSSLALSDYHAAPTGFVMPKQSLTHPNDLRFVVTWKHRTRKTRYRYY